MYWNISSNIDNVPCEIQLVGPANERSLERDAAIPNDFGLYVCVRPFHRLFCLDHAYTLFHSHIVYLFIIFCIVVNE